MMAGKSGRVVQTPKEDKPYKVVIDREDGRSVEQPVETVREGEAIIKEETPAPPARDRLHDHPAAQA